MRPLRLYALPMMQLPAAFVRLSVSSLLFFFGVTHQTFGSKQTPQASLSTICPQTR
ncbi:MAG: hypothetical protein SPI30_00555 [Prevotella sp.]|nr:hypothetical protein [Prevotella sp.]